MKLHLLLLLLLLSIISNAYAEDISAIKDKLISVSNDEKDFKKFLEELNSKGIDLTDEEYIKEIIILRAATYAIDLKNYPNIKGLSTAEYIKTYPKQELTLSQKLEDYTNVIIYTIIFIIMIIIFSLLIKYKHKFKKTLSPQEIKIKEIIKLARAKGYTDEQILTQFLKQGYKEEDIKKLM